MSLRLGRCKLLKINGDCFACAFFCDIKNRRLGSLRFVLGGLMAVWGGGLLTAGGGYGAVDFGY